MDKFVGILLIVIGAMLPSSVMAKEMKTESPSQIKIPALYNEENFLVYYAFADKTLEGPLKEKMIKQLEKLGTVTPGDDKKLTAEQKQEKYRTGGMVINVIVTPLEEENSNARKLPVIGLQVQVRGGVEILENGSRLPCTIWESEKFIGMTADKNEYLQKTVKVMDSMLDSFVKDYKKANSSSRTKPQFFLYS